MVLLNSLLNHGRMKKGGEGLVTYFDESLLKGEVAWINEEQKVKPTIFFRATDFFFFSRVAIYVFTFANLQTRINRSPLETFYSEKQKSME